MTILVDKCMECLRTCFGADLPGADETSRPAKVFARDVVCPDGQHTIDQEWTVSELVELLDSRAPIFHCVTHSYRWNPDPKQLEYIRRFANAFENPGGNEGALKRAGPGRKYAKSMQTRRCFVRSIALAGGALTLNEAANAAPAGMFVALNSTLTNNQVPWPEFARLAARVGYGGADFTLGVPLRNGAAATAELYRSLQLRPSFCNLPVNPAAEEDVYQAGMDSLDAAAKFVSEIGGHCMMLVVSPSSDTPKDELRARMKERLKPASDLLGKYKLQLGLEFLGPKYFRTRGPYEFIWRLGEMVEFGREIGPNVGVVLDSWHWHHAEATAADIVSAGKSGIVLVHISDAAAAKADDVRDNQRLLPGEGIIDFGAFFGALKKIGFEGSISPEPLGRIPKDMPAEEGARIGLETTLTVMRKAGAA